MKVASLSKRLSNQWAWDLASDVTLKPIVKRFRSSCGLVATPENNLGDRKTKIFEVKFCCSDGSNKAPIADSTRVCHVCRKTWSVRHVQGQNCFCFATKLYATVTEWKKTNTLIKKCGPKIRDRCWCFGIVIRLHYPLSHPTVYTLLLFRLHSAVVILCDWAKSDLCVHPLAGGKSVDSKWIIITFFLIASHLGINEHQER